MWAALTCATSGDVLLSAAPGLRVRRLGRRRPRRRRQPRLAAPLRLARRAGVLRRRVAPHDREAVVDRRRRADDRARTSASERSPRLLATASRSRRCGAAAPAPRRTLGGTAPRPTQRRRRDRSERARDRRRTRPPPGHRLTGNQVIAIADRPCRRSAPRAQRIPGSYRERVPEGPATAGRFSFFARGEQSARRSRQVYDRRRHRRRCSRRGPGSRSRGRWRAAIRARSGARSTRRGSGSRCTSSSWRRSSTCAGRCACAPRPARAAVVLGLAGLLQRRPHRHVGAARLPAAALPPRRACCGSALRRGRPDAADPAHCALRARRRGSRSALVFLHRLPHRAERHELERDRRRLRGRDRRRPARPRQAAVRALPVRQRRTATPTARSNYEAYVPVRAGCWLERHAGTTCRPRTSPRSSSTCSACVLLFLIGRRVRGPTLGIALAYAWVAYPFTLFALEQQHQRRARRARSCSRRCSPPTRPLRRAGRSSALAGLTKFAPLALAPLLRDAPPRAERRARRVAGACFAVVVPASALAACAYGERPRTFYDRTIGFQASRGSPFSVWGLYGWTDARSTSSQLAAVVARGRPSRSCRGGATWSAWPRCAARADRAAARRDALVLPLHRLVLPAGDDRRAASAPASSRRRDARHQQLLDRRRPPRLRRAADQDAHQPRVLLGGLEAHAHLRAQRLDRLLLA